jgi:hypothetical protein
VLVIPEAGKNIDRIEWAKQLVANAVRSLSFFVNA